MPPEQAPLHNQCFHCELPLSDDIEIKIPVMGESRAMCCEGCAAVAQAIVDAKLESYYRHRTVAPRQGSQLVPDQLRELKLYDHPRIQKTFVQASEDGVQQADLILEGITCAACVWLNQQHLSKLPGVLRVEINYTSLKAVVQWDPEQINLSDILKAVEQIGYTAHPYDPQKRHHILEKTRKDILKRLGVAGAFGMQVMGLAISLYLDDGSMEDAIKLLMQRASFILCLPVIFYSAQPFFQGAVKDLKNGRFGMDTPVALGIGLAFTASVFALISGRGEIYFDSVCMFTFLLLAARYLELSARNRAADNADIAHQTTPVIAHRLRKDGSIHTLPALELEIGDRIIIYPGDIVPADAQLISGQSSLDESILTGESLPALKQAGDSLIGGSLNVGNPITAKIVRIGNDTVLSGIQQLLDKAQHAKPLIAQLADRIAGGFVLGVLGLATLTGLIWYQHTPQDWLAPTIAVLIVSCPCALSLATPASITTAIGQLLNKGIIISNKTALETLHQIDIMIFDKTGTLTKGEFELREHRLLRAEFKDQHFAICSAIEAHSEHPIAKAFTRFNSKLAVHDVRNLPGAGLSAEINDQRYFIGTPTFIKTQTGHTLDTSPTSAFEQNTQAVLADDKGIIALYSLSDTLRPHSVELIQFLKRSGIQPIMLTGDNEIAAASVANQVGIETIYSLQLPDDKLRVLKQIQNPAKQSKIVAMVGDGVNDAAVLAGADCAIATQGAAALASAGSDVLLLTPNISAIESAINTAKRTHRIIKQNLLWAVGYNLLAIPAAALGYVPPWLAAIGMSLSSLLVVLNALRLKNS